VRRAEQKEGQLFLFDEQGCVLKAGKGKQTHYKGTAGQIVHLADGDSMAVADGGQLRVICKGKLASTLSQTHPFTALLIDSRDQVVAGNTAGEIHVASSFESPFARLQWHSGPVNCLAEIESGFVSGGNEGVIVFWRDNGTKLDFVPRLGSPILKL
jgi:hypothetical protein